MNDLMMFTGPAFMLFAGVILLVPFFYAIPTLRKVISTRKWKKTPCQIRDSVRENFTILPGQYDKVIYSYEFNGIEYTSDCYSLGTMQLKKKLSNIYQTGETSHCYVNPGNPGDAVLSRDFEILLFAGFILFMISTGMLFGSYHLIAFSFGYNKPVGNFISDLINGNLF